MSDKPHSPACVCAQCQFERAKEAKARANLINPLDRLSRDELERKQPASTEGAAR